MIYVAALQAVPRELIEAAGLEGAGRWAVVRHVQIPFIRPAIGVSAFFAIVGSLQLFDVVIPLTNGGPSNSRPTRSSPTSTPLASPEPGSVMAAPLA